MKFKNALTVDVEDYFHVAALANSISVDDWDKQICRVEKNTHLLLDLFDEYSARATFFVLGWVAERYPGIVKEINNRGHEVASHGYSHQLIYTQKQDVFRQETIKSKQILEDITGNLVDGYRAASYSITNMSLWALDILYESGFKYDSSIFPIRHDRYGIPDAKTMPNKLITPKGNVIAEFPLTTSSILGMKMPAAGGGYFRLYPYALSKYLLKKVVKQKKPFVFYLHPWEIDPEQPKVKAGLLSTFRHYNNLDVCESRLKRLLTDFNFSTMRELLEELSLI